jgi:hypothetical protein
MWQKNKILHDQFSYLTEIVKISLYMWSMVGFVTLSLQWFSVGAGIVQSGWMKEGLKFETPYGEEFSLFHSILTDFGVHTASYPMGTGGLLPQG